MRKLLRIAAFSTSILVAMWVAEVQAPLLNVIGICLLWSIAAEILIFNRAE